MENNQTAEKQPNPKRLELIQISNELKPLVQTGEYDSVNEAIVETIYRNDKEIEFNTFKGWLEKGFKVKKGSKGKPVWGQPKRSVKTENVDS